MVRRNRESFVYHSYLKQLTLIKGNEMKRKVATAYLLWYYTLPTIQKVVGILDCYRGGTVRHIDFYGECTVVWIGFPMITKAYSYK